MTSSPSQYIIRSASGAKSTPMDSHDQALRQASSDKQDTRRGDPPVAIVRVDGAGEVDVITGEQMNAAIQAWRAAHPNG
jgi:hypothetical protein